jgi:hypothetical protein
MRYIHLSDFTGIIFRRTYPELEGSIIPLCQKYYLQAGARYNESKKLYSFPSGAFIRMGFMEHKQDWRKYMGHEYAYMGFDELTNFLGEQYTSIAPWSRSRCPGVPPYRRSASNPGGIGHAWVKARFVETCPPQTDGEERYCEPAQMWWQPMKGGPTHRFYMPETGHQTTSRFIPSRVFDNVDLLKNNPNYLAQLLALPPDRRKAYLEGSWDIFEGQFFWKWREDIHCIDYFHRRPDWPVIGGLDYGQETVLEVATEDYDGNIIFFEEVYSKQEAPSGRANQIANVLLENQIKALDLIYDTNMDLNLEYTYGPGKTPTEQFMEVFDARMGAWAPMMNVVSKHSTDKRGYRAICNETFKEYLDWKHDQAGKLVKKPKIYIVKRKCPHLVKCIPELVADPDSEEGMDFIKKGAFDHPFDAAKMVLMALVQPERPDPAKNWEERFRGQAEKRVWEPGMG